MLLTVHKLLLRSSLTAAGPCLDSPAPLPGPGGHDPGSSSGCGQGWTPPYFALRCRPAVTFTSEELGHQTSDRLLSAFYCPRQARFWSEARRLSPPWRSSPSVPLADVRYLANRMEELSLLDSRNWDFCRSGCSNVAKQSWF